jgi:hypothetical protein
MYTVITFPSTVLQILVRARATEIQFALRFTGIFISRVADDEVCYVGNTHGGLPDG